MKLSFHQFRFRPKKYTPYFPSAYCVDYLASDLSKKEYGMKSSFSIYANTEEDIIALVVTKEDYEKFGKYFVKKFKNDQNYLKRLIEWSENQKNSLKEFLENNFNKQTIKNFSNAEIAGRYIKYVKKYRNFHLKNTPPWWCGADHGEKELRTYLLKRKTESQNEVFQIITEALEYQTENFKEEMSFLNILDKIRKKKIKSIISINDFPFGIKKIIKSHIEEFSSIPFGYHTGVIWDEKYYLGKIKKYLAQKINPIEIKNKKLFELEKRKKAQKEIITKLKLPSKILNLAIALRQLSYLQEIKKMTQTKSHPYLQNVVCQEIARRLKIPKDYINYLTHDEIAEMLINNRVDKKIINEVQDRKNYSVLLMKNLKYSWLYKKEADKFFKVNKLIINCSKINKIKGISASGGFAKGVVKVCKHSTEIGKVKQSDILVTAMTTPDFVPAMKKASAFVTDEGGITCHAAIVAREMKKPCIIGTKIATKVLRDGDLVEVDADKGVVKIIKRAA